MRGDDGGSDAEDEGDPEAFCERLQELDQSGDLDLDDAEAVEAFEDLVALAPEEIDSDVNRIQRAFEELSALDEDDPDAFGGAFEIILDPRLASSLEDFAGYAEDECGLEVEGPGALDDFTDDFSDDLSDDFSDDLSDDVSPASDLRAYLEAEHPDYSTLATGIGTVEIGEASVQVTLTLSETTDADTAVAICEAPSSGPRSPTWRRSISKSRTRRTRSWSRVASRTAVKRHDGYPDVSEELSMRSRRRLRPV